jgi:hypothetical protein
VSLFKTVVGIDPSGRRLAVAVLQGGVGNPAVAAPPMRAELRSEREAGRAEEAGELLRDYVARNGLAGSEARLCIPADRVFSARLDFPDLRARDLTPALSMELERLFPFPASKLLFRWRRLARAGNGRNARFLVVASPSDYIDRWAGIAESAGLTLVGAVPSGWALSAAHAAVSGGRRPGPVALLRGLGDAVECALVSGGEPFFEAWRSCRPGNEAAEALSLVEEGMQEAPAPQPADGPLLTAPAGWFTASPRVDGRFEPLAGQATGAGDDGYSPWELLGAYGVAIGRTGIDLLVPESEGPWPRIAAASAALLAVAALALAIAWPATRYYKARAELARLDARVAALRPAVDRVADSMAALAEIDERVAVLQEASPGAGQPIELLRDLTGRIPQGTWLTGLRFEGKRVEMDGFSPSANELFPLLSQDGRFRKVEFASPITRQPDNLERFQIRAEYWGGAPKPAGGKP